MFATPAYAQAAGQAGGTASLLFQFVPLVLLFLIFFFLIIRPQQQRAKAHKAMIDAVKKGDEVVTGGGLIGRVNRVNDSGELEIELAPTVRVRALKSTLAEVRVKGTPVAANDAKN